MIFKANANLFRSMIENLPMAVLLIDENYRHIYTNSLFVDLTGLHQSESAGHGWTQRLSQMDQQMLFHVFATMKEGNDQQIPDNFFLQDIKCQPLTISRRIDPEIGLFYTITFFGENNASLNPNHLILDGSAKSKTADQNEAKQATLLKEEQKNKEELITSNQHKDKLLAILAHDMGAPIAALKGLTESLLDIDLDKHERTMLRDSLLKQLAAVAELTENILLWATDSFHNTESEKKETVGVLQIIEESKVVMEQQAALKKLQFSYDIPADLKVSVNKNQLCMVVRNLFNNAIKYTQCHGFIHICAELSNDSVHIKIADNGIGIPEDRQHSLFTFTQTNTYGTNGEKGIGLGLLLCKQYIEANNGTISIISKQNIGTTVIAAFPNALSAAYVSPNSHLVWK